MLGTVIGGVGVFVFLLGRGRSLWFAALYGVLLALFSLAGGIAYSCGLPFAQPATAPSPEKQRLARALGVAALVAATTMVIGLFALPH